MASSARTRLPEFGVWHNIIQRCEDPKRKEYARYGARGIRICARWRASFDAFLTDMGPRPSPDHQIDRIDNDGHYEPGNCRWTTRLVQARNSRACKLTVEAVAKIKRRLANGESISSLAREHGVVFGAIYNIRKGITWGDVAAAPAIEVAS